MGFFSGMKAKAEARRYDRAEAMKTEKLQLDARREEYLKEKEYYKSKNLLSQAKREAFQERVKPVTEKLGNIRDRLKEVQAKRTKGTQAAVKASRKGSYKQVKEVVKSSPWELGPGLNRNEKGGDAFTLGRGIDTNPSNSSPFSLGPSNKERKKEKNNNPFVR